MPVSEIQGPAGGINPKDLPNRQNLRRIGNPGSDVVSEVANSYASYVLNLENLSNEKKNYVLKHIRQIFNPETVEQHYDANDLLRRIRDEARNPGNQIKSRKGKAPIEMERLANGNYNPEFIKLGMMMLQIDADKIWDAKEKKRIADKNEEIIKEKDKALKEKQKEEHEVIDKNAKAEKDALEALNKQRLDDKKANLKDAEDAIGGLKSLITLPGEMLIGLLELNKDGEFALLIEMVKFLNVVISAPLDLAQWLCKEKADSIKTISNPEAAKEIEERSKALKEKYSDSDKQELENTRRELETTRKEEADRRVAEERAQSSQAANPWQSDTDLSNDLGQAR